MTGYDIHFFSHSVRDVKSLYIEVTASGVKVLSFAQTTVWTPHKGNVFSLEEVHREGFLEELLRDYPSVSSVYVILNTLSFSLVPKPFFNKEERDIFLVSMDESLDEQSECVYCDFWEKEGAYLVYKMPLFCSELVQRISRTDIYHLSTALQYVVSKKGFDHHSDRILLFLGADKTFYLMGYVNHQLVFAKSYVVESPSDVQYYVEFCLQQFFNKVVGQIHLLLFTPTFQEVQMLVHSCRADAHRFRVQTFTQDELFGIYGITNPPLMSEDLFLLLLLSLCES